MRDPSAGSEVLAQAERERLALHLAALDVTSDSSVREAVARAHRESGGLDALVANAGFHAGNALEDTPLETFRALLETNYVGLVRCVHAVLPRLREQGRGVIAAVTSQSGRIVHPTQAAYAGSKFAAEAALEALALEVAPFGIRVRIVEPGLTFTAAQAKSVPWPRGTAYQELYRRMGAVFAADASIGSSAELVGEVVADAVESSAPRLRWPVGRDAERNLAVRSAHSDEAWIAGWPAALGEKR